VLAQLLAMRFPTALDQRRAQLEQELEEQDTYLPIFVCMLCLPGWPCSLHIFEPRYRLMVRRCMESGRRMFGMVAHTPNGPAQHGVILDVSRCQPVPDGRLLVDSVATRRFRIIDSHVKDDYLVAKVEYIEDEPQDPDERNASGTPYRDLVRQARALATFFTERLPRPALTALHHHFGELPQDDDNLAFWLAGALQLDAGVYEQLVQSTSKLERLSSVMALANSSGCALL